MMIPFTNDAGLRDYRHPLVDEDEQHGGRLAAASILIGILVVFVACRWVLTWYR